MIMPSSPSGDGRGDPYQVLGVGFGASRQDISRAYRRAVHGTHPDAQPQDPLARARFEALTEAYDLLMDPARRAEYDRRDAHTDTPRPEAPRLGAPPGGPAIWAGPVHIASATIPASHSANQNSPDPHFEDPPVFLGLQTRRSRGWRR